MLRGHQIYKRIWNPTIGEGAVELNCVQSLDIISSSYFSGSCVSENLLFSLTQEALKELLEMIS